MIKTSFELLRELKPFYKAPKNKILSLEEEGKIIKIKKGLYETNPAASPLTLSNFIYGPSYISFEAALSFWDLIPEKVNAVTSATFKKNKTKTYKTPFGIFTFRDIPAEAYLFEIYIMQKEEGSFLIAGKEKALCDTLYRESPLEAVYAVGDYLFESLRIDRDSFFALNLHLMRELVPLYKSSNLNLLGKFLNKTEGDFR